MAPKSVQHEHPALGQLNNNYFLRDSVYKVRLKVKCKNQEFVELGKTEFWESLTLKYTRETSVFRVPVVRYLFTNVDSMHDKELYFYISWKRGEKKKKNLRKELNTFFKKISILIDGSSDILHLLGKIAFHLEEQ